MTADTRYETLISVVAPLHQGDGAAMDAFLNETVAVLQGLVTHYEIILVDDGTTDDTADRVRALLTRHDFVRFLRLSRHFGEETAIAAGLDVAIGDYVVVMLPNMDPPLFIPKFFERARAGADIVYGVRMHRHAEPAWYRAGARVFYWYINNVVKAALPEDSTQFRCMTRQVVNAITQIRDPERYLRLLTSYIGFKKEGLPYAPINRTGLSTVRPKGEAVALARALVLEHTTHPLQFVSWGAVIVAAVAAIVWGFAPGALAFFIVSLVLATIAEYIGGIVRRLRMRPGYYVSEEQTSAVLLREERKNVVDSSADALVKASAALGANGGS